MTIRRGFVLLITLLGALATGSKLAACWDTNLGALALYRSLQEPRPAPDSLQTAGGLLDRAARLDSSNRSALRLLGLAWYAGGNNDAARDTLSRGLQLSPMDTLMSYWRGAVNWHDGRYFEAGEDWLRAGFLPYKLRSLRDSAAILSGQGDSVAAEAALQAGVQLAPSDPTGCYALGGFYWSIPSRRSDAAATFRTCLALDDSGSFQWYWAKGRLHLIEKQWDDAIAALEQADRSNPGQGDVLTHLGYAYWQSGRVEQARTTLETVKTLAPEYYEPYLYLSTIAGESGDTKASVAHLLAYLIVQPNSVRACDRLVQILSNRSDAHLIAWTLDEMTRTIDAETVCESKVTQLQPAQQ